MIGSSDDLGSVNDRAELLFAGGEVLELEEYTITQSFFQQPAHFEVKLGSGEQAKGLMALARPNTPFQLQIGGRSQFVGAIDGYSVTAGPSSGTEVTIRGRDNMAPLHDACVRADTSFTSANFIDLVGKVLSAIPVKDFTIIADNSGNRSRKSGLPAQQAVPAFLADVAYLLTTPQGKASIVARAGERWLHYLLKEFNLAGLFLFAGANGEFILTTPNGQQPPTCRLVRQSGALRNAVNTSSVRYKNDTTSRYSDCTVLMRGGDTVTTAANALTITGRAQSSATYVDQEMAGFGFTKSLVVKSKKCQSPQDAQFLARKHIAQANRTNIELVYTVSGHTVPSLVGGQRAIWNPDTVVDVQDDELGISGSYWVEAVTFRSPPTTTEIVLQRPQDLIYGGAED